MADVYTGAVKCNHVWTLKDNDGHVRTYVCDLCDANYYQEEKA